MKRLISSSALALALSATALAAQDNTVKSETKVKGDDARSITMTGCLVQQSAGLFTITGEAASTGEDLTLKSKTKTDVDDEKTKVTSKTQSKVDATDKDHDKDHKDAVGTSGSQQVFDVSAKEGVDLAGFAGRQVRISGMMLDPATKGDDDAKVKIEEKSKVKAEDAPDAKLNSKTKAELPRGAHAKLMAISVEPTGRDCAF